MPVDQSTSAEGIVISKVFPSTFIFSELETYTAPLAAVPSVFPTYVMVLALIFKLSASSA